MYQHGVRRVVNCWQKITFAARSLKVMQAIPELPEQGEHRLIIEISIKGIQPMPYVSVI